jgi:hypothetical protein
LGDFLEDFVTARIARVGIHEQERFDLGHSSDNTSDRDEFTEMSTLDSSNSEYIVSSRRLKVDVTRKSVIDIDHRIVWIL